MENVLHPVNNHWPRWLLGDVHNAFHTSRTHEERTNMLEPDQWESVLSRARGTIYRGTERISSNAVLNLLEVGPDAVIRQKVAKRKWRATYI